MIIPNSSIIMDPELKLFVDNASVYLGKQLCEVVPLSFAVRNRERFRKVM